MRTSSHRPLVMGFLAALGALIAAGAQATDVPFDRHTISTAADGARWVSAADVDDDGDVDILSASYSDSTIAWYEYDGTPGGTGSWTEHVISNAVTNPMSVLPVDMDSDGDMDALSASYHGYTIEWFENDGTPGGPGAWERKEIADGIIYAREAYAADLDGDGDTDVVSASQGNGAILWHENGGNPGEPGNWAAHTISTITDGAHSVFAADMDGDGDLDVLSGSANNGALAWHENDGTPGGAGDWTERSLADVVGVAISVFAADVDADGDMDALAAYDNNTVAWYENDGTPSGWTELAVSTVAGQAHSVFAADVDADGDVDVLSASYSNHTITWYENDGTPGGAGDWFPRDISTAITNASSVFAVDVDGDGDVDVLSASEGSDSIDWWENDSIHRNAAFASPQTIGSNSTGAKNLSVHATDVDGDGDIDVVSGFWSLFGDRELAWHENDGTPGGAGDWAERVIADSLAFASITSADVDRDGDTDIVAGTGDGVNGGVYWYENDGTPGGLGDWNQSALGGFGSSFLSVCAADVDGDGDQDVLSAEHQGDKIRLHRNSGAGSFGTLTISTGADGPIAVSAADLDDDGDIDVLSASDDDDTVAWYSNDSGSTPPFTPFIISSTVGKARGVDAADLDRDGDQDVLSAGYGDDTIAWHENDGESTPTFSARIISSTADQARSVLTADLDRDGDLDVLAAASTDPKVWYRNDGGSPPSFLAVQFSPLAGGMAVIDVADVDRDGDLDVLAGSGGVFEVTWHENVGGQLAIRTTAIAPVEIWEQFPTPVLEVLAEHNGRPGDSAAGLNGLGFLFERSSGDPLITDEAEALIENLFIYRDSGSGRFERSEDLLVHTVDTLELFDGVLPLNFDYDDHDPDFRVDQGSPARFFIVVEPKQDATQQDPNAFRVTEIALERFAFDLNHGILLSLEVTPEVSTDTMTVTFPDCNANTVLDHLEVQPMTLMEANFEGATPPAGWAISGLWNVTDQCAQVETCSPGSYWAYFGRENLCDFDTGARTTGELISSPIRIPVRATDVSLSYCSAYDGESGDSNSAGFDWAWVEADTGSNICAIDLDNPPDGIPDACVGTLQPCSQDVDCREVDDASLDGEHSGGETRTIDLLPFKGWDVTLSWHFDSVDGVTNDSLGWQFDNVRIQMGATSQDCNGDFIPDECEPDCNDNDFPDDCDVAEGAEDCNSNLRPDVCELFNNDCDGNDRPDECDPDCLGTGQPDTCDIAEGYVTDCGTNGIPDVCEPDCNENGSPDDCDILDHTSTDCSGNGIPDECELQDDCNNNGIADSCDIFVGTSHDCNRNGIPDECDISEGSSSDDNTNGIPDECEIEITGFSAPCLSTDTCMTTGGDSITILGSGFTKVHPPGDKIWFGDVVGIDLTFVNDTEMTVATPPLAPGQNCSIQTSYGVELVLAVENREPIVATSAFPYRITSLHVPEEFTTIQSAIDAAEPGSCITVAAGIYMENITFSPLTPPITGSQVPRESITLTSRAVSDPSATRILGGTTMEPTEPVVVFSDNPSDVILTGFELTLGNSGIVVKNGASPLIVNNRIDNNFSNGPGGGILVKTSSSPEIRNNRIATNFAKGLGGGVAVQGASVALIDNEIRGNDADGDGGGLYLDNPTTDPTLSGNRIEQNLAGGNGGGIFLGAGSTSLELADHEIVGNAAGGSGGGIHVATGQQLTLHANEILDNSAQSDGGGVYVATNSDVTIVGNRISGNRTLVGNGAGVFVHDIMAPTIRSNLISGNVAQGCEATSGGLYLGLFSTAIVEHNTFKANVAQRGGGIVVREKGEPSIRWNVIAFNQVQQNCHPIAPPVFSPGILIGNDAKLPGPGPMIVNNTFHENTGGNVETGAMHGVKVGLFEPDWINNIVSTSGGWGIYCDRVNTGVRIEYNDLFANAGGTLHSDCGMLDDNSILGDPQFADPSEEIFDFSLSALSPARNAGEDGVDMGAIQAEAILEGVVAGVAVMDDGSSASIEFSQEVLDELPDDTELLIRIMHMDPQLLESGALTLIVEFQLDPDPGDLPPPGVTLKLPLRAQMIPGEPVILYRWENVAGQWGFVDTGNVGTVDETGRSAVFTNVQGLSIFAGGPAVVSGQQGLPGEASDPRFEEAPFTIGRSESGFVLAWSEPPAGASAARYRLYRVPLGTTEVVPVCEADLGTGTSIELDDLPDDHGLLVVAMNVAGEGSYGRDGSGQEREMALGSNVCP